MRKVPEILDAERMRERYGSFYNASPKVHLDQRQIPARLWPLLPYAEFWGIADDLTREILVEQAPRDVQLNLKDVVSAFEDALEEWLVRSKANKPHPSGEYVAFAAMIMAADFA